MNTSYFAFINTKAILKNVKMASQEIDPKILKLFYNLSKDTLKTIDALNKFKVDNQKFTPIGFLGSGGFADVILVACDVVNKGTQETDNSDQPGDRERCQYAAKINKFHPRLHLKLKHYAKACNKEYDLMHSVSDHPNIISSKIHFQPNEFFEGSLSVYILQYLPEKEVLHYILENNMQAYDENTAKDIIHQCLTGLKFLKEKFICHRDIKLENIFAKEEQKGGNMTYKIGDFGLADQYNSAEECNKITGAKGTCQFVAPEIMGAYDLKIDIWSLGTTLFVLMVADWPLKNITVLNSKKNCPKDINFYNPVWNGESGSQAKDLLCKMMVTDPKIRWNVDQCLSHPWFMERNIRGTMSLIQVGLTTSTMDNRIIEKFRKMREEMKKTGRAGEIRVSRPFSFGRTDRKIIEPKGHTIAGQ